MSVLTYVVFHEPMFQWSHEQMHGWKGSHREEPCSNCGHANILISSLLPTQWTSLSLLLWHGPCVLLSTVMGNSPGIRTQLVTPDFWRAGLLHQVLKEGRSSVPCSSLSVFFLSIESPFFSLDSWTSPLLCTLPFWVPSLPSLPPLEAIVVLL